jgi:hypothetical protein
MTTSQIKEAMSAYDWSRVLVLGGLASLDTEGIYGDMSTVDRVAESNGQRIKCVVHTLGKGASCRAMMWAQNSGKKHAPFKVNGRGADKTAQDRLFDVGKPTVVLVFPGLSLSAIIALDQARKRGIPVIHIDEFYPILTPQDCKEQGISYKKAMNEVLYAGRPSWKNGTLEEVVQMRNVPPDNTFLQSPKQKAKFDRAELELKGH